MKALSKINLCLMGGVMACAVSAVFIPTPAHAAPETTATNAVPAKADPEGDRAWGEVMKALKPPTPPAEWNTKQPSKEEIAKFNEKQKEGLSVAIDKIQDFIKRFPNHPKAVDAHRQEYELLKVAAQMNMPNRAAQLEKLNTERTKNGSAQEDDRFEKRAREVQEAAMKKQSEGEGAVMAEFEKGARSLQKEFPKRPEVYQILMMIAGNTDDSKKASELAKEIVASNADDETKEQATALVKKLELVGKPVAIKFKAVDGREVDLAKMTNKVVLVDFWATWCGPCVKELPHVMEAYEKLHGKGFEIVGLSFDQKKDALEKFVADKKMPWPQYFDGKGWMNEYGQKFGINSIPAMWLVDKKGNLRDMNARADLEQKISKLLAE